MSRFVMAGALSLGFLAVPLMLGAKEEVKVASDNDFVNQALTCGSCGVRCSEIAAKKATDDQVRDFAQRMAKEHSQMNDKIADSAKRLKVGVVTGLDKESQEKCDNLAKQTGADLDRNYLKMVIQAHEKGIKRCEQEAKNGTDADLKAMAASALPTLQKHLEEARALAKRLDK